MKTYKQILEDSYASDYKVKKFLGPDGKWQERKLRPHRVDFKNSKMRGEPVQDDDRGDVGMKEEKSIEVTMKSGHKFTAPIKVSSKDWHIVKHPTSGKQYRVDHKGNTLEESDTKQEHDMGYAHASQGKKANPFNPGSASHAAYEAGHEAHKRHFGEETMKLKEGYYGGKQRSAAWHADGGANDEGWDDKPSKQADQPHAVHINGKKWKSFGSQSHAQNVAKKIKGATVHKEEVEMQEQAPVAPVPDRKYIKGTPEHKAYKATKKPINGMPTNKVQEVLSPEMGAGEYIKDFQKSDAPQFKGKTQEKRRMMGIAAYMAAKKGMKEEFELNEANHREFASQGLMHPEMAKHMKTGQEVDFYHSKTGDKISGVVKHTTGGQVHIKANKDGKLAAGEVHKFTVSSKLNEAKDETPPFDGPYTKTPGTVKDKSGAVHTPMSRARDLARQAMKKQMKEELDLDLSDDEADALMIEALTGNQHKLDKNKNGKVDSGDLKMLRGEECPECHKAPCECGTVKESGEVETRSLSFGAFMSQLNEYTPGPGGVTRVQGRSYGAQYRDPEGEDDADDKKKQVAKSEPAVKRGRGRPAGSKSGANQKVTTGKKGSGVDYTGYKLHLPNSNR